MYTGNTRVSVFSNHDCIICSDSSSSSGGGAGNCYSSSNTGTEVVGIYCKCMELLLYISYS